MIMDFVVAIVDRARAEDMLEVYRSHGLPIVLTMLGNGTATSEHLSLYGLEATEKALVASVACGDMTRQLIKSAKRRLFIDIPGNGIMLAVPIKSVGGGKAVAYLNGGGSGAKYAPPEKFAYEVIVAIANEGYTDAVMNAARAAGARGGTVIHGKGTGAKNAQKFYNISIADEKEIVMIVASAEIKSEIMRSILEKAGPGSDAGALVFSLPVSEAAGFGFIEEE